MSHPTAAQTRILRLMAAGAVITDDYGRRHTLMVGEESHGRVRAATLRVLSRSGWIRRDQDHLRYVLSADGRAALAERQEDA